MLKRGDALKIIEEKVKQVNVKKHMLATEALMAGVYDFLKERGEIDLGGTREEWMMAGLLHDGDYCGEVPPEKQGIMIADWVKERKLEIPGNVVYTMAAHNWEFTGVEPKSKMDWALFCGDSLTGLIVACALVMPDKKLAGVKPESVIKKFTNPSFAGGTRREDIKKCEEELGISLEDFIKIGLEVMQKISSELGL